MNKLSRLMVWPAATFAAVVISFFAATAIAQWKMLEMDRGALEIASDMAPSIFQLTAARSEIRHLQVLEEEALDRVEHGSPAELQATSDVRQALDDALNGYLVLPAWRGEQAPRLEVLRAKDAVDRIGARFESEVRRGDAEAARATLRHDAGAAADGLSAAISKVISGDARHAQEVALDIRRLRTLSAYIAFALDLMAMAIAIFGAFWLSRVMRAHANLAERHAQLESERASELEHFAGTVAHDILSPLSTASLALQLARRPDDDITRTRILERGASSIQRVTQLVDGLLAFARAGGSPEASGVADVDAALRDAGTELQPAAAAAGIELDIEHRDVGSVRCHPGVLTSLILNLSRNAIKYMGTSAVRRIDIHASDRGTHVRVEVEDTGPGLSPDVEARAFEPYARARGSTQPGIGLGLATVKRLAESHGGRVGVDSDPGRGCRFWFELPKAMGN